MNVNSILPYFHQNINDKKQDVIDNYGSKTKPFNKDVLLF